MTLDQVPTGPVLVALLAVVVALLVWGVVLFTRSTDTRLLQRLGPELVAQPDEAAVLRVAARASRELFGRARVEIAVDPHADRTGLLASVDWRGGGDHVPRLQPLPEPVPTPGRSLALHQAMLVDGQPIGHIMVRVPLLRRVQAAQLLPEFAADVATALAAARRYHSTLEEAEARRHEAQHDALTGLGNRTLLAQQGPGALTASAAQGDTAALLLLDLDGFKWVNDTLGHTGGDEVLAEIGRRMRAVVRDTDLAVRLGGDEFAVLAPAMRSPRDAEGLAGRLLEAICAPLRVAEASLEVGASMGIAVHGVDGRSLEQLLEAADAAVYTSKQAGRGRWSRASPPAGGEHRANIPARLRADALREALDNDDVSVHLQPQVDAATGDVLAFEALARWQHPRLGPLQPQDFLSYAEQQGLMRALTVGVLERSLSAHRQLLQLAPGTRISVNIPARSLLNVELLEDVQRCLETYGTPPSSLTVEITEPTGEPPASLARALTGLQRLGCRVSIQEFGTGQSSLTALSTNEAIRELKIAPGLASRVAEDPAVERLVRAAVGMAHALDLSVVAEGVETAPVVGALRRLECDALQGYHVQPPADLPQTLEWLRQWPQLRAERLQIGPADAPP